MRNLNDILNIDVYNRPTECPQCGGIMIFKGCGEYKCEDCKYVAYDDYGKVRNYVEQYPGVTSAQVSDATGVKPQTIRTMLRESRLEIAEDSNAYLKCEICGVNIRSGRVCPKCEVTYNKMIEEKERQKRTKLMEGFGMGRIGDEGEKRFKRDK